MPRLGVQGAAIATVLARIVEAAIVVFWSHATAKHKEFFKGLFHRITVPKEIAKGIILKGTISLCRMHFIRETYRTDLPKIKK